LLKGQLSYHLPDTSPGAFGIDQCNFGRVPVVIGTICIVLEFVTSIFNIIVVDQWHLVQHIAGGIMSSLPFHHRSAFVKKWFLDWFDKIKRILYTAVKVP